MGWLRRLFGTDKPSSPATAGVEPTARTGTGKDWLTGDPPVPPLHATPRQAQYTLDDGREGIVEGFELRASDGRLLYDNRCGVTRWGHLGLYQPDVVGQSYRGQQARRHR